MPFGSLVLNPKSNVSRSGDVEATAKAFTVQMRTFLSKKKATVREARPGLDAAQVMPGHTIYFLSALHEEYCLHEMCTHISSNMLSPMWRRPLHSTDAKISLAFECGLLGVSVEKPRICQKKSGFRFFACRNLEREMW